MQGDFYAFLSRMKYINRWGLMRCTVTENIQEHSHMVAVIAHALAVIGNTYFGKSHNPDFIASVALYHDAPEIITGDLPTPIKYFSPEIRQAYDKVECVAKENLLDMLPEQMREPYRRLFYAETEAPEIYRIVKAADTLSAYIKCIEEESSGSNEFSSAKESIYKKLKSTALPEAEKFLELFGEGFAKTLDRQGNK